jgi:8-oxo-dGTP diphosphatase
LRLDFAGHKNPLPTVDVVIHDPKLGVVLVKRKNPPPGWALPGGFVEYGETVENAARREALEETALRVRLTSLLGVYSHPDRDSRQHTISTVFTGVAENPQDLRGGDDAQEARFFPLGALPEPLAFDHGQILKNFADTLGKSSG